MEVKINWHFKLKQKDLIGVFMVCLWIEYRKLPFSVINTCPLILCMSGYFPLFYQEQDRKGERKKK